MALALATASAAGSVASSPATIPAPSEAPIAMLFDMSSGQILVQRDVDRRFVPASITKVMTLFLAFELIDQKKLNPDQIFTVRPETFEVWHNQGSRMFLPRDARVSVDDLLMGIAAVSANDGAVVLAEGAVGSVDKWVALMNAEARALGMRDSHFGTPNGWPDEGRTYTSARDLVTLARALITRHPNEFARYIGREGFAYNGIAQPNHDPMIGAVKGADGLKTGFTNEAGYGFLGTAQRDGRRLVMVVAAVDTGAKRKLAARELMEWGFASHTVRHLFNAGSPVAAAEVQDGETGNVGLIAQGTINASFAVGTQPNVKLTVRYEGPLQAPIAKGEQVAELEILVDGQPPSRVPLVTDRAVAKAGPFQRLLNGLKALIS